MQKWVITLTPVHINGSRTDKYGVALGVDTTDYYDDGSVMGHTSAHIVQRIKHDAGPWLAARTEALKIAEELGINEVYD